MEHGQYPHWNGKDTSTLFYPNTTTSVQEANILLNEAFVKQYGYNPLLAGTTLNTSDTFIVTYNYDNKWILCVMRFLTQPSNIHANITVSITANSATVVVTSGYELLSVGDSIYINDAPYVVSTIGAISGGSQTITLATTPVAAVETGSYHTYYRIANPRSIDYRISCNVLVDDYLSKSVIAKGDSTLYGDFSVKSTGSEEIFHVDTLNKISSNMYPLGIGTTKPTTMLDIEDTSINDINAFIGDISTKTEHMNALITDLKGFDIENEMKWFNALDKVQANATTYPPHLSMDITISVTENSDTITVTLTAGQTTLYAGDYIHLEEVAYVVDTLGSVTAGTQSVTLTTAITSTTGSYTDAFYSPVNDTDTYYLGTYTKNGATQTILFSSGSNDVKETTATVDMTTFSFSDWNALTNSTDAHFLVETITQPTHADILTKVAADTTYWNETPSTTYIYELNMQTKNVGDTTVVQFDTYPTWAGNTFTDIMTTVDPNNTPTIQQYIEPVIQPIIQDSLLCTGSVNSFVHQDIGSTTKYSIARSVIFGKAMTGRRRATYTTMQTNIINGQVTSKTAEIAAIAYMIQDHIPLTSDYKITYNNAGKAAAAAITSPALTLAEQTVWGEVWAYTMESMVLLEGTYQYSSQLDFWDLLATMFDLATHKTALQAELATMITTTGTTTTINSSYVLDDNLILAVVPTGSTLETLISIYTAFTAMTVYPKVYLLGYEWNIQTKRINITRNPNIHKCFQYINAMNTYFNAIKYAHNQTADTFSYGFDGIKTPISELLTEYPTLATNLYMYTYIAPTVENGVQQALVANTTTVSKVGIGDDYSIQLIGAAPVQISDETSTTVKQMHTNLINAYNDKQLPLGEYGVLQIKGDGNQSYYFLTYQYSENQIIGIFVDITTDFITPSVHLTGDMKIDGQLDIQHGILLGGKILQVTSDGNGLMWGDKIVNLT